MAGLFRLRPAIGLEKGTDRVARRLFQFFIGGCGAEKDHHLQVGIAECHELPGRDVEIIDDERPLMGKPREKC